VMAPRLAGMTLATDGGELGHGSVLSGGGGYPGLVRQGGYSAGSPSGLPSSDGSPLPNSALCVTGS
jgi:hypothetical protein